MRPSRHEPHPVHQDALRALAGLDLVEHWKEGVRARFSSAVGPGHRSLSTRLQFHLGFVLVAVLAGARHGAVGSVRALLALSLVLLTHELPRALFARAFGRSTRIVLSAVGGDTELQGAPFRGAAAVVWTTLGSLANFVAAGALMFFASHTGDAMVSAAFRGLAGIQALWGTLQVMPVVPSRTGIAIAQHLKPSARFAYAAASGTLLASLGVIAAGHVSPLTLGVLALAIGAAVRVTLEAHAESRDQQTGIHALIARARERLSRAEPRAAATVARQGLSSARSLQARCTLWELLAWSAIGLEDPFLAHSALQHLPERCIEPYLLASYLRCCNRNDEALELSSEARQAGCRTPEISKLVIELLFRRGEYEKARAILSTDAELLSLEDYAAAHSALVEAGVAPS